jgi:tetratricopeptide (TPR) repeat protein
LIQLFLFNIGARRITAAPTFLKNSRSNFYSRRPLKWLLVTIVIIGCLFAIKSAATFGFSRILVTYSLTTGNRAAAEKAIQLAPKDAEAHFAAAALMNLSGAPDRALLEFERAVALRPADYGLWSELGLLRDQMGDSEGALATFDEAIRHAPYYSQPRWNRGNVLLRKGQYEAAFNDLSQAAQSNPDLIPGLIDLAWSVSRGDVTTTEGLAQIKDDRMRIAFARFLARHGKATEAMKQFGGAGNVPDAIKHELVEQLLAKGAFKEAFDIWKLSHRIDSKEGAGSAIYDGGFEGSLSFAAGGFGWRVPRDLQDTTVSLDSTRPQSGSQNLRIEFTGNSNPRSLPVSQLILVEPSKRYRVNFASRSQDVVTGGLPLLNISDATSASGDQKPLGQSRPLAKGTSDWEFFNIEFTTGSTTSAVVLSVQRENCNTSLCPIFGAILLDSFSLEKLK